MSQTKAFFRIIYYLPLLTICLVYSCQEEKILVTWTEIPLGEIGALNDIHFTSQDTGYVVGGIGWESGKILSTYDGGDTWTEQATANATLTGIAFDSNGTGYVSGFNGYFFRKKIGESWDGAQLPTFHHYNTLSTYDGDKVLLGFCEGFNSCQITTFNPSTYLVEQVDSFGFDYSKIAFVNERIVLAAGYGQVIRSVNQGVSWTPLPLTGEYFTDVQFLGDIGYMCGFNGSILKSQNQGESWTWQREGDRILVKDKRFRSLHFLHENYGFIVGDDGLCWRTDDGGRSWKELVGLPDWDFTGVYVKTNEVFLISKSGRMLKF